MLDKSAGGNIAEGNPRWLKENVMDPRVRDFFNRQVSKEKKEA